MTILKIVICVGVYLVIGSFICGLHDDQYDKDYIVLFWPFYLVIMIPWFLGTKVGNALRKLKRSSKRRSATK